MTSATGGWASRAGLGSRRTILAALAISLVLNLCFVAGAAWTLLHEPPSPAHRFRAIAGELALSPEQTEAFDKYFKSMIARTRESHAEIEPIVAAAWAEIAKPKPDTGQISKLFQQAAEKRREFQQEGTEATLQFLATLSPEQRARFVALVRERRAGWHYHHHHH